MEMNSSIHRFDSEGRLIGCGIDVETSTRFTVPEDSRETTMPFVFSGNEIRHALGRPNPSRALCISFSCKEALRKALGRPFNFDDCETFPVPDEASGAWSGLLHLNNPSDFPGLKAYAQSFANPLCPEEMITSVFLVEEQTR